MYSLALLFVIISTCLATFDIDDALLFKVNFGKADDALLSAPDLDTVIMTTNNNEKYQCRMPKVRSKSSDDDGPYEGPHALKLIEKLFVSSSCAYRLEHYWTYELCHGRYLRQFHEERDGKEIKTQEYFLGRYTKENYDEDDKILLKQIEDGELKKPPKMKIETMNMPYFEMSMSDGTLCDLTGRPRNTRIKYVCYPTGKHEMYSFKESSTCEYEVIVLSPLLCQHPDYKPEETSENIVDCRPADEMSSSKPLNLLKIEAESIKLRSENLFEAEFIPGQKPGQVKIEIKKVNIDGEDLEDHHDGDVSNKDEKWHESHREPIKPLMDPQVVKEFLKGDYCLHGGTGWWKYEFCYGKKVVQYHEERGSQRTVITLGSFDENSHLQWMKANPNKSPKPVQVRKSVSHFYNEGDVCDITGKPRQIEVKLKCKKADSPSTVGLYLLEPKTCEYILGVESPLICDVLHLADENGLIDRNAVDMATGNQAKSTESVDERKTTMNFAIPFVHSMTEEQRKKVLDKIKEIAKKRAERRSNQAEKSETDIPKKDFVDSEGSIADNLEFEGPTAEDLIAEELIHDNSESEGPTAAAALPDGREKKTAEPSVLQRYKKFADYIRANSEKIPKSYTYLTRLKKELEKGLKKVMRMRGRFKREHKIKDGVLDEDLITESEAQIIEVAKQIIRDAFDPIEQTEENPSTEQLADEVDIKLERFPIHDDSAEVAEEEDDDEM